MFSSIKSQSHYKRSFYVPFSSSATTCPFNPWQYAMRFRGATKRSAGQTLKRTQTYMFLVSKMFLTRLSPLRTDLVECYTPYFQCQSTTTKLNTLLWLTETEHISFAAVMSTIYQLPNTLQLTNHHVLSPTYWCSPNPHIKTFIHRTSFVVKKKNRQIPQITLCAVWNPTWIRKITETLAASTLLDGWRSNVARSWWYFFELCSTTSVK